MSDHTSLADLIEITPRYRRSVNIQADLGDDALARGYVVSSLAAETIGRVLDALSRPQGTRAWTIVGPYGTGKSSLLTFLANLLDCRAPAGTANEVLEKAHPSLAASVTAFRRRCNRGLLPVVVVGRRIGLARAILESLIRSAEAHWSERRGRKPAFIAKARAILAKPVSLRPDDAEVASLVVQAASAVQHAAAHGVGILLVIDELGKLLEYAAEQPDRSDIYLLQLLAESSARLTEGTLAIVGVLHQSIEAYSRLLPQSAKVEWAKVGGRYETVPFLEPANHLLRLTAEAIRWKSDAAPVGVQRQVKQAVARLPPPAREGRDLYLRAAPLNPITARLLGPVLRQIGQNERSLFSFLTSQEPCGFSQWLATTPASSSEALYPPHLLFDYVRGIGLPSSASAGSRAWTAAEEVLARLPKTTSSTAARLVKTIAVLSAAGPLAGIPASAESLKAAHLDVEPVQLEAAIAELSKSSAIVFRSFNNSYQLWDGSDIDVDAAVHEHAERLTAQGGLAAHLTRLSAPRPVMAPRHYHRTGTFRYFVSQYLDIETTALPNQADLPADGIIYLLLPDQRGELPEDRVAALCRLADTEARPTVIAVPGQARRLRQAAIDVLSVQAALEHTGGLEADPVARRELKARRDVALERFVETRDLAWTAATPESRAVWRFHGKSYDVNGRATRIASDLFDALYEAAPVLKNELVNRRDLSTAAAAARRELIERMISRRSEERLGIDGYPAELSIYLSVLDAPRLHRRQREGWTFAAPGAKSTLGPVWSEIDSIVRAGAGARLPFLRLYERIERPPFGVRRGVAPILALCYYLANEGEMCLYEDGSFVPAATPDLVHRLLRRPEAFEIQFAAIDLVLSRIGRTLLQNWDAIEARGGAVPLLSVVRGIMRTVKGLSAYASQTNRVSVESRRLRSVVLGARDPVKLLSTEIPEALGIGIDGKGKELARRLDLLTQEFGRVREELLGCDEALLGEIGGTLARLLGGHQLTPAFLEELRMRAHRLKDKIELMPAVRRFVDVTDTPIAGTAGVTEWASAVATMVLGKPPTQWTDEDTQHFPVAAMQICRAFLSAEQLVLELKSAQHDSMRLVRVSVLDSQGSERSGIAVLRPQSIERVDDFLKSVRSLAAKHEVADGDVAFAVIAALLDPLNGADVGRQVS